MAWARLGERLKHLAFGGRCFTVRCVLRFKVPLCGRALPITACGHLSTSRATKVYAVRPCGMGVRREREI